MTVHFASPFFFLLLAPLAFLAWLDFRRGRRPSLTFSSTSLLAPLPRSLRQRLAGLPRVLRYAALAALVVALARPESGQNPVRNVTQGIAIELVLDHSGSMSTPMVYQGKTMPRFEAVKAVVTAFVMGDGKGLRGRPDDMIGVILFAGFPDTISPLTQSRDSLVSLIKQLAIVDPSHDGTAIGDAIALGAARLKTAEQETVKAASQGDAFKIKSKIMILLTDGENNAGKRSPAQAAALAAQWGIKIYAIGVSSQAEGGFLGSAADVLQGVADATGGVFRVATDERSLYSVYHEIDRLEKTEVNTVQYLTVEEQFVPFALAGLALLLLELLLSRTVLRRLP